MKVHTANGVLTDWSWKGLCLGDVIKRCIECTLCFDETVVFNKFKATVRCEDPNPKIYSFVGNLELGDEGEASTYPISPSKILLRNSKLRNTEFINGVAIFIGRDTKVACNLMTS
ncbi:probable phospholipid-transporting ATPase 4 [Tanacetum coccineum]